mmetsp:Transcript_2157/g.4228  ORF Transcript_2157/g.4228 Transcript_2157/m.4228 type:complete len:241 (+) Transcript_2157:128-850(+)
MEQDRRVSFVANDLFDGEGRVCETNPANNTTHSHNQHHHHHHQHIQNHRAPSPPLKESKRATKSQSLSKLVSTKGQRKRAVRFNHRNDRVYGNKMCLDKLDCKALWYSSEEIRALQRQTKEQQYDIHHFHPHYATWCKSLHSVYHSFCSINNAREIMAILEAAPSAFHPIGLGMERRAVSLVNEDAASRRRQIYCNLARIQSAPIPDPWLRAQILREMCRSVSKPSRLYARHVALMSAAA